MPRYDYKCKKCGAIEEAMHGFDDEPTMYCLDCGQPMGKMMGMPNVAPSATPSRNAEIDFAATKTAEKNKDKDMAAYKRLRQDGVQPPAINGSAKLEARAEISHEVNSGHTFATATSRKRNESLIKDMLE